MIPYDITQDNLKNWRNNNKDNENDEKSLLNSAVNIYTDSGDFGAVFVYNNGYIITNYHVIYNSKDIKVVTYNRDEYNASLVGFNYDNDIAVLKIDKQLEPMVLGNSDEVKIGETITAIGNPNGDLSFSAAKGKVVNVDKELLDKMDKERKYIWYNGNAISGYSGGPVYDKEGKTIGIIDSIIESNPI